MTHKVNQVDFDVLSAAPTAVEGRAYYDAPTNCLTYYNGSAWVCMQAQYVNPYSALQIKNTDVTTDIATTTAAVFSELFGTITINTTPADYTVNLGAGTVTINNDGLYEISGSAAWVDAGSNASRTNIALWIEVNGVQVSPNYQNNYIRDSQGHTESGQGIHKFLYEATAGDVIEIWRQQIAGNSGANLVLEGTNNYVQVERIQ